MSRPRSPWYVYPIRAIQILAGTWLLVHPPAALASHHFVKVAAVILLLGGIFGPHRFGEGVNAVLIALVYVVGLGPMRLVGLFTGDDSLGRKAGGTSFWKAKPAIGPMAAPLPAPADEPQPMSPEERRRMRFQF